MVIDLFNQRGHREVNFQQRLAVNGWWSKGLGFAADWTMYAFLGSRQIDAAAGSTSSHNLDAALS